MFDQKEVDKQDKRLQNRIDRAYANMKEVLADPKITKIDTELCDLKDALKRAIDELIEFRVSIANIKALIAADRKLSDV